MIDLFKTLDALRNRQDKILDEYQELISNNIDFTTGMSDLEQISRQDFIQMFQGQEPARPAEFQTPLIRNLQQWDTIEDAVAWSVDQLQGYTLSAIDGSQIKPSKELSYPIALVQAGYFLINFSGEITTDHDIFPKLLLSGDSLTPDGMAIKEGEVSLARQEMEIQTGEHLLDLLDNYNNPIILLDGTLIYSYMIALHPLTRQQAIDDLVRFLRMSERRKIPVVSYIDTSFAKDLFYLLREFEDHEFTRDLTDASILQNRLSQLGQYTIPFYCRRDPISEYGPYASKICFSYTRVNSIRPVRLEFPSWIYEDGIYDEIMTRIIAEAIVSHGYPRVLTRAHETAVLTSTERKKFHNLVLNHFNNELGIEVKEMSKANMKHKFY